MYRIIHNTHSNEIRGYHKKLLTYFHCGPQNNNKIVTTDERESRTRK